MHARETPATVLSARHVHTRTHLQHEVSAPEVGDGARQARAAPDEAQEERPLLVAQLVHDVPEPANQIARALHVLVRRHRLEQRQRNVGTAAGLATECERETHVLNGVHKTYANNDA